VFSLLGTTYGGNGSTTFGLPDLRGRVPVGAGNGPNLSPYIAGEQVGTESVTLLSPQMPMHTHTFGVPCSTGGPEVGSPANAVSANYDPTPTYASTPTPGVNMFGGTSSPAGGSTPHENRQPSLGINYIICLEGIFPTRP
jgi:microcystin-dependent protein